MEELPKNRGTLDVPRVSGNREMRGELFSDVLVRRTIPGRGLCASAALHLTVLVLIVSWRFIKPTERLQHTPKNYELQIIHYSLPEPLLFASSGRQGSSGASKGGRRRSGTGVTSAGPPSKPRAARLKIDVAASRPPTPKASPEPETAALLEAAPPAPPKPVFQVPQKQVSRHRDLIIQPDFSPEVRISGKVELPNLFLWSQSEIRPLVRQLKPFLPGEVKRKPPSPKALPDAPPTLDLPNQHIQVSVLKIASAPQLLQVPTLPVSVATTAPVRIERQTLDAPSELPVTPLPPGQPVNLLAIMNSPAIPNASYTVEAGNRFPAAEPGSAGGGGRAGGTSGGSAEPGGAGAASEGVAAARETSEAGNRSGSATASGKAAGAGPGGNLGGRATGNSNAAGSGPGTKGGTEVASGSKSGAGTGAGAGKGAGTGSGTGSKGLGSGARGDGTGAGLTALSLNANSVSIRTESPNTSSFEVVVVNQSAGEILPEGAGILTGQPVYTVYMAVPGSPREWILQYAVPHSREPVVRQDENSIQLGAATPLRAPYPLRKGTLQLGEQGPVSGRVVVYGAISEKGSVEDLRVIRGLRGEVDAAVVACLRQFLFRPAVRDGVPVLVEALFGIPLN